MQRSTVGLLERPDRSDRMPLSSHTGETAGITEQGARFTPESRRPDGHHIRIYFCRETATPCPGARVRICSSNVIRMTLQASVTFLFCSKTYIHVRHSTTIVCGRWSLNYGFQILLRNIISFPRRYLKTSQEPTSSVQ